MNTLVQHIHQTLRIIRPFACRLDNPTVTDLLLNICQMLTHKIKQWMEKEGDTDGMNQQVNQPIFSLQVCQFMEKNEL